MQLLGVYDQTVMREALDECFGSDGIITFDMIEQLQKPLLTIYEEREIKGLTD